MQERTQFIWGATTILLWALTFIFIAANHQSANSISFHYLRRQVPQGEGWKQWSDASAASTALTQPQLLSSVGCNAAIGLWAPICTCLSNAYASTGLAAITPISASTVSPSCPAKRANAQVLACFMSARRVQKIAVIDSTVNPYAILLMINSWSAIVGAALLVRGKLADKDSLAPHTVVQAMIIVASLLTLGLCFNMYWFDWMVLVVMFALLLVLGWVADQDPAAWYINQFHLLFAAGCPTMMVLFNSYTHRLDTIYFTSTVLMALVLGLAAAARMHLERLSGADPSAQYWDPATWLRVILVLLTTCLLSQTYDEGDRGPTLKSAFYSWVGIAVYFSLAMLSVESVSHALYTDVLIRVVVTATMVNELFNA